MPTGYDYEAARSRSAARARIVAIYENRGLQAPANIEAQVNRIVGGDGAAYFDQVRSHAERDAQTSGGSPTGQTGTTGGDTTASRSAIRSRIEAIYENRGISTPPNIDAQVDRVLQDGAGYYDQIRRHAERDAAGAIDGGAGGGSGQGDEYPAEADEEPINYSEYAPSWMKGQLKELFVEHWARTGSAQLAMEALRRSSAYDQEFVGNRREDGSLRYTEGEYMSTRDAFRETLGEFGQEPPDKQAITALFINDVSASEFYRGVESAYRAFTEPGGETPQALMKEFLQGFTTSGSAERGWEAARDSSAYDQVFEGNRREDGSLRMDEQEYYGYRRGWQRALVGYGLNPSEFQARGRFVAAVTNELSIQELESRLQFAQDEVIDNVEAVSEFYSSNYGIDLSPEAILGMHIDPDIQKDVLERRVQASQIGGEAAVRGFSRSIDRAESLARAGITQQQARDLYGQAQANLPGLAATTRRYNRGTTTLGQFEEASVLGDVQGQNRLQSALEEEQSSFSSRSDTRRDQDGLGLAGLRQR